MAGFDFQADGRRTNLLEMGEDQAADFVGFLIGHEAAGDFCARPGGNDCFTALALIATGETVDLKSGTGAALLIDRKPFLAKKLRNAKEIAIVAVVQLELGHLLALEFG